ncbi:hypothetical protein Syun_022231 [Stephania yunnanensis]|uniref:UFSP1/2/DUB catalytic domain-containing protein n=1 Tax=Stephania yunnanensis TaxID=152371 RepID=A0AAP0NRE5_9MAGN
MAFSDCPFCHQIVPSSELERHADNHFVEVELARDADIAQQIAAAPTTLSSITDWENGKGSGCSTSACGRTMGNEEEMHVIIEKISCLTRLQIRATFYKVEGGLLALLRRCLEMESRNSVTILSDFVDHFQSVEAEDSGWGCGLRNIQMLSSHLLLRRLEAREVLFGGSGFVPDIASLQRWLEIALQRGFDVHGAYSFNHKICG